MRTDLKKAHIYEMLSGPPLKITGKGPPHPYLKSISFFYGRFDVGKMHDFSNKNMTNKSWFREDFLKTPRICF